MSIESYEDTKTQPPKDKGLESIYEPKLDERGDNIDIPLELGIIGVNDLVECRPDYIEEKETIESQFESGSYRAYSIIVDILNHGKPDSEKATTIDEEELKSELSKWMTSDKLQYIGELKDKYPELKFMLVITPNVEIATDEIIQLATIINDSDYELRDDLPYSTIDEDAALVFKQYEADEISGYDPSSESPVRFKLYQSMPSRDYSGTASEQKKKLSKEQSIYPFLCVSSVFDDICCWQTLREQNGSKTITDKEMFNMSARHFDLDPKRASLSGVYRGYSFATVPSVYIDSHDGGLQLGISNANYEDEGERVMVG